MQQFLSLDYGTKFIGVAIADDMNLIADELTTLDNTSQAIPHLISLINTHQITTLVVGIPYHENNTAAEMRVEIEHFVADLVRQLSPQPAVHFIDEYGTSQLAEKALVGSDRKKLRDPAMKKLVNQKAAKIILQTYLDGKR
ncbi:MAG: Holliday junction resolvase RuvX [bacterium]